MHASFSARLTSTTSGPLATLLAGAAVPGGELPAPLGTAPTASRIVDSPPGMVVAGPWSEASLGTEVTRGPATSCTASVAAVVDVGRVAVSLGDGQNALRLATHVAAAADPNT